MKHKKTIVALALGHLLVGSISTPAQETCIQALSIQTLSIKTLSIECRADSTEDVTVDGPLQQLLILCAVPCPESGTCPEPEPQEPSPCAPGATCFEEPGSFFTPTAEEPVRRIVMAVPPGSYTRIHLRMDVRHGGWQHPASGLHNVFWLALGGNRDLIGYVNLLGPGRDRLLMRHGMGLVQEHKPKVEKPFVARPGETYTFDYVYDTAQGAVELQVWNRGEIVGAVFAVPNVDRVEVGRKDRFLLDISFPPGAQSREPTTFGWEYQNLLVEYLPAAGDTP